MSALTDRIRTDLTAARRARERATVRVLRTALAAIANAESRGVAATGEPVRASDSVAGAAVGVGATEAARRVLDDDDVRSVIASERAERLAAAASLESAGAADAGAEHRSAASLLERYL